MDIKEGRWIASKSEKETEILGGWIGKRLRPGSVLSLVGPIGSGKTVFTRGVARGLQISVEPSEVTSPTFVLIKTYPCRVPLHHIDLYRLDRLNGVDRSSVLSCFDERAVTVIEWGEKAAEILPWQHLEVEFKHEEPMVRHIRFKAIGGFRWRNR